MRTRLFLRTAEFLWQEGHTAHATRAEALEETKLMNQVYADFVQNYMAIPVIQGTKTASERFAGAEETYCIEALMQDGKALQAGTSHFLGQNFAKAFDVKYATSEGGLEYVWATSWGVSTRLIGALIMTHSDDNGLVLPPNLAPIQVVIIPIYKGEEQQILIAEAAEKIKLSLESKNIRVKFDNRDKFKPGFKFNEYELKGVPLRIAIGPKDLENGTLEIARRDTLSKTVVSQDKIVDFVQEQLKQMQGDLFDNALKFREENITEVNDFEEFKHVIEGQGGFVSAHWDGTNESEEAIKKATKATIRCIPLNNVEEEGKCVFSGKPSIQRVLFAKAY
jgi:prolyl-tRNA synthetase